MDGSPWSSALPGETRGGSNEGRLWQNLKEDDLPCGRTFEGKRRGPPPQRKQGVQRSGSINFICLKKPVLGVGVKGLSKVMLLFDNSKAWA